MLNLVVAPSVAFTSSKVNTLIITYEVLISDVLNFGVNPNSTHLGEASGNALAALLGRRGPHYIPSLLPLPPFIPPNFPYPYQNLGFGNSHGSGGRSEDNQSGACPTHNPNWMAGGLNREIHPENSNLEFLKTSIEKTNANLMAMNSRVHHAINVAPEVDRGVEETKETPFIREF